MKINFLSIAVALALTIIAPFPFPFQFTMAYGQVDEQGQQIRDLVAGSNGKIILNENGVPIEKGSYFVLLKNETFDSLNNDPKFDNPNQYLPSAIPERQAQIVPELQHEYTVKTGEIIYDKVEQYNGTTGNSLSPLKMQGGYIDGREVYSHATKGFMVKNVDDISVFINDPDIALVEEVKIPVLTTEYISKNALRMGILSMPAASVPNKIEKFPNVDIAVLDIAILRTHPDLNVAGSTTQCFVPSSVECYPPSHSHGTMAAGIATARDNLAGVVGVAAGARVWSVANCNSTTSNPNTVLCNPINAAIDWVTANAATFEIASISQTVTCGIRCTQSTTSTSGNTALNNAVSAGITVVVGAGNDGVDADNKSFCNASSVICVSAMADTGDGKCGGLAASQTYTFGGQSVTQRDDQRAYFSNFGSVVDMMASGLAFSSLSTALPGSHASTNNAFPFIGASDHGGYAAMGGTSEATPWVSGAAALLKSIHPEWTPAQIKSDLQTNGIVQTTSCNSSTGVGGLANNPNSGSSEKILNLPALD